MTPTADGCGADPVLARLERLHPKVIDLSLGRIERLLAALGHPERRLPPVIHIAGTNGKGSLLAFLRTILKFSGYRVHSYSSPHLVRFNERIVLDGQPIAEPELIELLERCEAVNDGRPITFFEITTAAAFTAFAETDADAVILETGLGGRLDATNVIDRPVLTAITPIAIDHQHYLGESLTDIAGEKAAILKPEVPGVIGPQLPAVDEVIAAAAEQCGAQLFRHGAEWRATATGNAWAYESADRRMSLPPPSLFGPHQMINAGTAVACIDRLDGFAVDDSAIANGLAGTVWPGRLQRVDSGHLFDLLPLDWELWLDGGHNAAAGAALADTAACKWRDDDLHLVVGMLNSKTPTTFLSPLAPLVSAVRTIAIPGEPNAISAADLAAAAQALGMPARPCEAVADAVRNIVEDAGDRSSRARVLICGSLYLVGRILATADG